MSCDQAHYLPLDGTISMSGELYRFMILKIQQDERQRIADKLRDRAADLVADGDMASAELVFLGKLIDWLEREQK